MRDYVADRPSGAERRRIPLRWRQVGEVVGKRAALGRNGGPNIRYSKLPELDPGPTLTRLAQRLGWIFCRCMRVFTQRGPKVSSALAAIAIRGAIRTGRVRAAVIIHSAASSDVSAGIPS